MIELISPNFLFFFCLVLLALIALLFVSVLKANSRLNKSINLMNDLYKITQQQGQVIAQISQPDKYLHESDSIVKKLSEHINRDIHQKLDSVETNSQELVLTQLNEFRSNITSIEHKVEQLMHDDPQLKMYNRANQLAKSGASIEDIVEACQLPRAEAEVLVSLHRKSKNK